MRRRARHSCSPTMGYIWSDDRPSSEIRRAVNWQLGTPDSIGCWRLFCVSSDEVREWTCVRHCFASPHNALRRIGAERDSQETVGFLRTYNRTVERVAHLRLESRSTSGGGPVPRGGGAGCARGIQARSGARSQAHLRSSITGGRCGLGGSAGHPGPQERPQSRPTTALRRSAVSLRR